MFSASLPLVLCGTIDEEQKERQDKLFIRLSFYALAPTHPNLRGVDLGFQLAMVPQCKMKSAHMPVLDDFRWRVQDQTGRMSVLWFENSIGEKE